MNAIPAASSPRLACRVTRGWISVFGNDTSALRSAHVAGCPDCQAFFAAGDELDSLLRRDAMESRAPAPDYLEQDILSAVRRSTRPARRGYTLPVFGLAGVAAAIAGLIVVLQSGTAPVAPTREIVRDPQLDLGALTGAIASLQPQAEAILQKDPLQNEASAIVANARSAVQFLAKNFLPSDVELAPARRSG